MKCKIEVTFETDMGVEQAVDILFDNIIIGDSISNVKFIRMEEQE